MAGWAERAGVRGGPDGKGSGGVDGLRVMGSRLSWVLVPMGAGVRAELQDDDKGRGVYRRERVGPGKPEVISWARVDRSHATKHGSYNLCARWGYSYG